MTEIIPSAKTANAIDVAVGQNLRRYRRAAKLSQTALGDRVGVTFQQVQKYEKGTNRIGASRLWLLSQILEVAIADFYVGLSGEKTPASEIQSTETMSAKQQRFLAAFNHINNDALENQVLSLCQVLAESRTNMAA